MSFASVDLPAPVGPTRAIRSPAPTSSDTSCSTGSLPYANVTRVDLDLRRRSGRSTAPGRSATLGRVSRTPKILLQRRARGLHGVVQLAELLDRLEQVVQVEHERGDRTDGHDVAAREAAAPTDDHRRARDPGELDDREVLRRDAHRLEVGFVLVFVGAREPVGERALAAEGLHDPHTLEALLQAS